VENKPPEPEAIEIDPPEPEPPQITYFPASYLPHHRSRSPHPFTSAPTPPNPSTTPVAPMAPTTSKELTGIGKPEPFKGDPSDLDRFFNDCHLFLDANEDIYNTEKKKVIFMLSYLQGGNAERYKTLWMEQKKAAAGAGTLDYGTAIQFTRDLRAAFKETNKKHDALHELRHIKQGSDTIDDFNNKFKLLISQTKITDDLTLIDAYRDAIKPPDPNDGECSYHHSSLVRKSGNVR
jgi:hypothetical protein